MKMEATVSTEANTILSRPLASTAASESATKEKLPVKTSETNPFSPFKSSTPRSQSPRSISPIAMPNGFQSENENSKKSALNENDDLKKIELIKQRMDMMDEQQKLKELLDKQEEMLKEKQVI